jgi:hypothetical protein
MKKIVLYIIASVLILTSAGLYVYFNGYFSADSNTGTGIKQCPEAWYDNQMPGSSRSGTSQYLIVEGERREISDFNIQWIQKNCEVNSPSVVS